MSLNYDNAVTLMATIEIQRVNGRHNQEVWANCSAPSYDTDETGHLIVDQVTGLPLGAGSCGTAFCAAGWSAQLAGKRLHWTVKDHDDVAGGWLFDATRTTDGDAISTVACEWLGLPVGAQSPEVEWNVYLADEQAKADEYGDHWSTALNAPALFDETNTVDDLYWGFAYWMGGDEQANYERLIIDAALRAVDLQVAEVERQKEARRDK
jgi:hypothetical protein